MNDDKKATKVTDVVEIVPEEQTAEEQSAEPTAEQAAAETENKTEEKKTGFWSGLKKGFNDFIDKSKKFLNETGDKMNDYFAAQPEINALNKLFEEKAVKLTDVKTGKERFAIITETADGATLLFRSEGDGTVLHVQNSEIKPDAHFSANDKVYKIISVDEVAPAEFSVEGNSRKLECFTATAVLK